MERRYAALRFVASLLHTIGLLIGILGILFGGLVIANTRDSYGNSLLGLSANFIGLVGGASLILNSLITALTLVAISGLIDVQISIEHHVRETAVLTRRGSSR